MSNHCRELEDSPARSFRRKLSDSATEAAATAPSMKHARTAAWAACPRSASSPSSPPPSAPPSAPSYPAFETAEAGAPGFDSVSGETGAPAVHEEYEVSSVLSDDDYLHDGMNDGDDDEESPCENEVGLHSPILRTHTAFPSGSWRCSDCLTVHLLSHRYCLYCWSPRRDSQRDSGIYPGSDSDSDDEAEPRGATRRQGPEQEETPAAGPIDNGEHGGVAAGDRTAGLAEACVVCRVRRRDTTIVHGATGHLVSCFSCAQRLHGQRRPCPVCRGPIQLVVRTFVS